MLNASLVYFLIGLALNSPLIADRERLRRLVAETETETGRRLSLLSAFIGLIVAILLWPVAVFNILAKVVKT